MILFALCGTLLLLVTSAPTWILSRPFTKNQVKVSFQDHPPNVPKMDPNLVHLRPLHLKMCKKRVLSRPLRMDPKMTLLSRPWVKKAKNQLLCKTIANRVKNLNPQYMVPVDEASEVISDPKSRKKATASHRAAVQWSTSSRIKIQTHLCGARISVH